MFTKRNRISSISKKLNIRTELHIKDYDDSLNTTFKVWRLKDNNYVYDGVYSKSDLLDECNNDSTK